MKKDDFGDRMKDYERSRTEDRLHSGNVYYARLDGRSFSKFTKGMERPFDPVMSELMVETTKYLVEQTNAKIGYTQSDEISLIWYYPEHHSQMMFDGKIQKLTSTLAAMASAKFVSSLMQSKYEEKAFSIPHFDCRVFELPSLTEGANAILWRVKDAQRNAVSMAAHHHFGHKRCLNVSTVGKLQMMADEGIDFDQYPDAFRNGTFVKRVEYNKIVDFCTFGELTFFSRDETPDTVVRHKVDRIEMPPFGTVTNRVGVIFDNEAPISGSLSE